MFASMASKEARFGDGSESGDEAVDSDLEPAVQITPNPGGKEDESGDQPFPGADSDEADDNKGFQDNPTPNFKTEGEHDRNLALGNQPMAEVEDEQENAPRQPSMSEFTWLGLHPSLQRTTDPGERKAKIVKFEDNTAQRSIQGRVNSADNVQRGSTQWSQAVPASESSPTRPIKMPIATELSHQCGLNRLSDAGQRELYKCARGEYDEVWYKFKRFETLNLLNLYHYQHQLVSLEEKIYNNFGVMSSEEIELLRQLMKDYQEALHRFEVTSKMKRPPMVDRERTAEKMCSILKHARYEKAPDALGMVDVMPQALGVEADGIRLFLSKTFHEPVKTLRTQTVLQRKVSSITAAIGQKGSKRHEHDIEAARKERLEREVRMPGGEKLRQTVLFSGRPYAIPISGTVDTLARLAISFLAGIFLLVPMVVFTYLKRDDMRLLATCLFVLAFAIMLSVSSKASNHELVTATATYSAVLVVFVGQTS